MRLEDEFEVYKFRHKRTIVKANLIVFLEDLKRTGVNIPSFMEKSSDEKADDEIEKMLESENGKEKFEQFYEQCWEKCCRVMP